MSSRYIIFIYTVRYGATKIFSLKMQLMILWRKQYYYNGSNTSSGAKSKEVLRLTTVRINWQAAVNVPVWYLRIILASRRVVRAQENAKSLT